VGLVVGALAEKTVANKQPVRHAAKGRQAQAKDTCIPSQTPRRSHEKALEHATPGSPASFDAQSRYAQLRIRTTTQTAIRIITSQSKLRAMSLERLNLRFWRIEILI
jgi:hypothetical protein